MAIDAIEAGLKVSDNYLSQLDQLIKSQILASWPDHIPGVDPIARGLDGIVAKAETSLQTAEQAIKTQIDPLIRNAIPNALDFIGALTKTLDSHLTQLIGNIATTEDVMGTAIKTLQQHSPQLANWVLNHVAGSFGHIALTLMETLENEAPDVVNPILDELLAVKELPPWIHHGLQHARARNAPIFAFIFPAIILASILPLLAALGEPFIIAAKQQALKVSPTKVADPPTLLTALMRQYINDDRFIDEMRQNGFAPDVAQLMLRNSERLLDPDAATRAYIRGDMQRGAWERTLTAHGMTLDSTRLFWRASLTPLNETDAREAFLRGLRTAQEHDAILGKLGYESDAAALRRSLYFYIPPAQDLIHMAIRNVFNPEIVSRFQLFGDFPAPFAEAAAQQGISRLWAERYWGAHWIVPGNEEAFAMFQRTTDNPTDDHADTITLSDGTQVHNIIGESTLKLLLREKDIAPFYRDKLTQLAYRPLTRIDVRRMASIGILSRAQVERAYLDLGYSQSHARQLAAFTETLAQHSKKDEVARSTDTLRKRVLTLWIAGKMDEDAARTALAELGATEHEIEQWLTEALLIQRSDRISQIESGIGKLYTAGFITAQDAEARLKDHDIPTAAITQLFGQWDLAIEYAGGKEHIHKHRELTKSEILEAYTDGMVTFEDASSMLQAIGYDENGATAELHLRDFRDARQTRRTKIDAIKAAYVNGVIEELDASNRLDALTIAGDQRDAYILEWTLQREARTERIPIATLRDMVLAGFIDEATALAHLKRHRFTDSDAQLTLDFWRNRQQVRSRPNA